MSRVAEWQDVASKYHSRSKKCLNFGIHIEKSPTLSIKWSICTCMCAGVWARNNKNIVNQKMKLHTWFSIGRVWKDGINRTWFTRYTSFDHLYLLLRYVHYQLPRTASCLWGWNHRKSSNLLQERLKMPALSMHHSSELCIIHVSAAYAIRRKVARGSSLHISSKER